MLIKFSDCLRVVVSSANLLEIDWKELGQVIWFQDFPKNDDATEQTNDFLETLSNFFNSSFNDDHKKVLQDNGAKPYCGFSVPENIEDINFNDMIRGDLDLTSYNYNSASVSLITSINGRIPYEDRHKHGLYRLAHLTSTLQVRHTPKIIKLSNFLIKSKNDQIFYFFDIVNYVCGAVW